MILVVSNKRTKIAITMLDHENIKDNLIELASLSDVRCKHSAVVVDSQGKIVAKGYNHKIQGELSIHVEVACLQSIENLSVIPGSTLIVIRMRKDVTDGFHLSKPCLQRIHELCSTNRYVIWCCAMWMKDLVVNAVNLFVILPRWGRWD